MLTPEQLEELSAAVLADLLSDDGDGGLVPWLMRDTFGTVGSGVEVPSWRSRAACIGTDPSWWFHEGSSRPDWRQAIETCETCPVAVECAAFAYEHDAQDGVWGGLTPAERAVAGRDDRTAPTPRRRDPRPCACGCGRTVEPGQGATHPACRQRRRRAA